MTNDINKVKVMGSNLAMGILPRLEELHCVTKEHPERYSLHGPAISDQAAITQRLMAVAPGELELEQGFPSLLLD